MVSISFLSTLIVLSGTKKDLQGTMLFKPKCLALGKAIFDKQGHFNKLQHQKFSDFLKLRFMALYIAIAL